MFGVQTLYIHLEEPVLLLLILGETEALELVLESIRRLELLQENARFVALPTSVPYSWIEWHTNVRGTDGVELEFCRFSHGC